MSIKTLNQILTDGIKETDWTYCKAEYAPNAECKVGMPEKYTPDGTKKPDVKTLYIVTAKFRDGRIETHIEMMFLSDGRFYWYDNLWEDDETVEQEIEDEWWIEPIAWIPYKNLCEEHTGLPAAPCKAEAVPIPQAKGDTK